MYYLFKQDGYSLVNNNQPDYGTAPRTGSAVDRDRQPPVSLAAQPPVSNVYERDRPPEESMTDSIFLEWTPANAPRRRLVFRSRDAGGWTCLTMEQRGDGWQLADQEVVTDVEFDQSASEDGCGITGYHGP